MEKTVADDTKRDSNKNTAQMQTPYGPMYAPMTSCEKQAKDITAGGASLLPPEQQLLGLEGAHHNHVHGWVKSMSNVKGFGKKVLKTVVPGSLHFVGVSSPICISL